MKMMSVAGLAVVLTGCGTAVAGATHAGSGGYTPATIGAATRRSGPPPSAGSTSPASPGSVLTTADTGTTVYLVPGQRLTIELAPGSGAYAWDRPRLTGSGLQLESVTGGYPGRTPMQATFLATSPGTATVSSTSDAPCLHQRPRCDIAQRVWTIRVVIRPSP